MSQPIRVAIVGAGNVGSTLAYALLLSGIAPEIVLIDQDRSRAEGQAMDLDHAVPFGRPAHVWAGSYADCAGATVTVVSAGANQRPGESRLDLLRRNIAVFRDVIGNIVSANVNGIIVVATNPVDILTYATYRIGNLPPARIIGSGTILDTARFRYLLARRFGVDPRSVHAYIIGEHGDSEVPVWSLANIAGARLSTLRGGNWNTLDPDAKSEIFDKTRRAAYQIIERKGATYYAVASGLVRIIEAIVRDQDTVLYVSSLLQGAYGLNDVCLSLPTVINRSGIDRVLELELAPEEREALEKSADVLRSYLRQLDWSV